jgi:hypothetical protein
MKIITSRKRLDPQFLQYYTLGLLYIHKLLHIPKIRFEIK